MIPKKAHYCNQNRADTLLLFKKTNKAYIFSIPSHNNHALLVCDESEHKSSIDQRGTSFGKLTIFPYQGMTTFERHLSFIRAGQSKMDTKKFAIVLLTYLVDSVTSEDALCYNG